MNFEQKQKNREFPPETKENTISKGSDAVNWEAVTAAVRLGVLGASARCNPSALSLIWLEQSVVRV